MDYGFVTALRFKEHKDIEDKLATNFNVSYIIIFVNWIMI